MTLAHHELTVVGIKQMYMDCVNAGAKFGVLVQLYHVLTIGSSIIFVHVSGSQQEFSLGRLLTFTSGAMMRHVSRNVWPKKDIKYLCSILPLRMVG